MAFKTPYTSAKDYDKLITDLNYLKGRSLWVIEWWSVPRNGIPAKQKNAILSKARKKVKAIDNLLKLL